ncbi:MAG: ATP synthase F1 subunit gamma [Flavobacteriia bacterium]|nr:ATP synthase F1 subunit gamma [Flavobacteriia bacterium]NBV68824.1 ATP synthase F1 subunit gamma [Flavobacteriia bacterium]NBV91747.1 ATP synthase F1 subunit gamma [Flavobacteriia bacterium]NBY40823.1 ATP synthase F1 subunit gamma [Flavobacteriia bacterium]
MANLKEIRNRISSVKSTMQITSAMKMVSAAKLKRAQDAIIRLRPFASKLRDILENVSGTLDLSENKYAMKREENRVLIIAITSNRGLCGGFNNNVIKKVQFLIKDTYAQSDVKVLCLGKKIKDVIKKTDHYYINEHIAPLEDVLLDLTFEKTGLIVDQVMQLFFDKEFDKIVVVYNRFLNTANQIVEVEPFLPIEPSVGTENTATDYIFEPGKEEIVSELIPKSLKTQLFKSLLDSTAAEHGARMTAMHKATDNASEIKKSLTLSYNKARQAAITNEILEIVGGAEALNA